MSEFSHAISFLQHYADNTAQALNNRAPRKWAWAAAGGDYTPESFSDLMVLFTAEDVNAALVKSYEEEASGGTDRSQQVGNRLQLEFILQLRRALRQQCCGPNNKAVTDIDSDRFDYQDKSRLFKRLSQYRNNSVVAAKQKA